MDHSKVLKTLKTLKTVALLVVIVILFLLVGKYYRNLFQQNSGNILKQDVAEQEYEKSTISTKQEEAGVYVNIRKGYSEEETENAENKQNSSLEFEVEEKDFTNSTEWVHIIEFE